MTTTNPTDAPLTHDEAVDAICGCAATVTVLSYQEAIEAYLDLRGIDILAIQATEARAQGLVDALEEIGRKSDEPTTVEFLVSQALSTWRRT
jgi:hypothetical protein